jgi:hypothetical protein
MTRISEEKLGEILAGLGAAAGPRETLTAVTARRLSAMTVAEAESLVTELRELREALRGVAEVLAEGDGMWRTCSGCHESEDGYDVGTYHYSEILGCKLGGGCRECGGLGAVWDATDYEDMAQHILAQEDPAKAFAEWLKNGPKLAKAAGRYVGIKVMDGSHDPLAPTTEPTEDAPLGDK